MGTGLLPQTYLSTRAVFIECRKVIGFESLRYTVALKSKIKTNRTFFPALCASCIYLLRVLIGSLNASDLCDWLGRLLWLHDTPLKTALCDTPLICIDLGNKVLTLSTCGMKWDIYFFDIFMYLSNNRSKELD